MKRARNGRGLPAFRRSLLSKYMLIVAAAVLFLPVVFGLVVATYSLSDILEERRLAEETSGELEVYAGTAKLEKMWHTEARELADKSSDLITARLRQLGGLYPYAFLFWADGAGVTRLSLQPEKRLAGSGDGDSGAYQIPDSWDAASAIAFMKRSVSRDPLTIVAFIGDDEARGEGFMVMAVPLEVLRKNTNPPSNTRYVVVLALLFIVFALVSWLFFARIRRRLLRLQTAMTVEGGGLPAVVPVDKPDEIGLLEDAFNAMVKELQISQAREKEEEELRKRLIAGLSHDLRTPLTVIRSHLFEVGKETLTLQGRQSIDLMDRRIADLSGLIDNLLEYNLLASGRIKLALSDKDVLRLLRESAASWYPVWTREGMEAEIRLEGGPLIWRIDESWFRRVLDNLYQNIMRHAGTGSYVGIFAEERGGVRAIVIRDRGPGLGEYSPAGGAGIGLAIVDMLLSGMGLVRETETGPAGTAVYILPMPSPRDLNEI
ncbi:HAMP domain-containing sensor histidine kinase [Paenibacillus stellifer]|uniref:HAMP domain-containing sensor histidine kinase n=1 Tax=Paenibacillus stellifer TaxID=169760 RepID=UPI000A43BEA7|nr:HAMP domain-containing sensor histidine kinase [Paenibacillus stellifer]